MARKRGQNKVEKPTEDSDFSDDVPDPKSDEYFYDDVDKFTSEKDKILLEQGIPQYESEDSDNEEEVMGLDLTDEDDVHSDEDDLNMESDIEENENDGLPNEKAWGKKKGAYYNTSYQDKDYMGFGGSDGEAAEAEEIEAMAIQKRLAQTLKDADFGLSDIKTVKKVEVEEKGEKIIKNLSAMTKKEKLQLLQKESPEFFGIVDDFQSKISELKDLEKLLTLVKDGRIPEGAGATFIETKYHLLLTYLTNISFYMMLKSRHVSVENHPVIKRILQFGMLLQQLEPIDEKLKSEMEDLIEKIENGIDIPHLEKPVEISKISTSKKDNMVELQKRIKRQLQKDTQEVSKEPEKKKKKSVKFVEEGKKSNETEDEKKALELYKMMKDFKNSDKSGDIEDTVENESDGDDAIENGNGEERDASAGPMEEEPEKRGITYQIAKNKGVTPHRKKEQRNPRVKHRNKFRKANIRRKGQVRAPRTEVTKYGGEVSGIRASVTHSVKLK